MAEPVLIKEKPQQERSFIMKRILTIALVLCMLVSIMTIGANAGYLQDPNHLTADNAPNNSSAGKAAGSDDTTDTVIGSQAISVKVKGTSTSELIHVYAVSFSTTEVVFEWNNDASTIWNPDTLKYESTNDEGSWIGQTQTITVNNYSDVAIEVSADNTSPDSSDENVTISVDGPLNLDSAYEGTATGSVKSGKITVSVDGTPEIYPTATEIGTFTLTVKRK